VRILHAANFVGGTSGGIRTMMRALEHGYAAAGHEVVTVVPGRRDAETATPYGLRVEIAAPRVPRTGGYRVVVDWPAVLRRLKRFAPERVEVSDRLTLSRIGTWARRHDVPSVVFSHERLDALLGLHLPRLPVRRIADTWNRRLAEAFGTVVCTTHWSRAEFDRIGARNLAQVPLGIDLDAFNPARRDNTLRQRLGQGSQVVVGAAVRLSPEKRPDLLVSTLRELHDRGVPVRLVVAGDGPERAELERVAAGLPVTFLGFLHERDELAALLASVDVVIAPGPYETFGLAALEAMASGTPVVAPTAGALPELVVPRSGVTAAPEPAALADAVLRALDIRHTDPLGPRSRAEEFSWQATVDAMLAVHGLAAPRPRWGGFPIPGPGPAT
jgi:alpha-1,6-mannosyltransferase